MIVLGEAEILIRPSTAGFAAATEAQTKAGLAKAETVAAESGGRMGKALATGIKVGAAGFVAVGGAALDLAAKYQTATTKIAASADISTKAAGKIGDAFLTTAGHSIYSAQTIAAAYAPVAGQLGAVEGHALSAGEALKVMSASQDLAEATGTSLANATADTAQIMQAYHLSVSQASSATDVLFSTARVTGISVDTLTTQLARLHSRLGDLTPSLAESGGLLDALSKAGVTGRTAMSALSTGFTTLLGSGPKVTAMAKELGVTIFNQNGQFVGMQSIIGQLEPKLAGLTQQSQLQAVSALFGASAGKQLLGVIMQGPAAYAADTAAVSKAGAAKDAAAKQSQTFAHQIDLLKATAVDLGIKLGSLLIPVITTFGGGVVTATNFVLGHKAVLTALAIVVGGVLTTAFVAFTVNKLAGFVSGIKSATSEVKTFANYLTGGLQSAFSTAGSNADTASGKVAGIAKTTSTTATTVATESTAMDTSFAGTALSAETATADIAATEATNVANVTAADTTIEGENATAATSFLGVGAGAAAILGGGAAVAAGALLGGDQGPGQGVSNSLPGFPNDPMPQPGQTLKDYLSKTLGLPPGYKGGPITAASYKGGSIDHKTVAGIFSALGSLGGNFDGKGGTFQYPGDTLAGAKALQGTAYARNASSQGSAKGLIGYLETQGLSANAAAGIAGNIGGQEDTSWSGARVQGGGTAPAPVQGKGYGLAQWTDPSRQAGLEALAKKMGLPASSASLQYAYIAAEINANPALKASLNAAGSPAAAALIASNSYERPAAATANNAGRESAATQYGSGTLPTTTTTAAHHATSSAATAAQRAQNADTSRLKANQALINSALKQEQAVDKAAQKAGAAVVAAHEKALAKQAATIVADNKAGGSILTNLQTAVASNSLDTLNSALDVTHTKALGQMVEKLDATHNSKLTALGAGILTEYQTALNEQTAIVALNTKLAAMGVANTVSSDIAKNTATAISDASAITLDQMAEKGLTGTALLAAQAKTAYDTVQQQGDAATGADQLALDQTDPNDLLGVANAQSKLTADQNASEVALAQAKANEDLANANAATATAISNATPGSPYEINIYGAGLSPAQVMAEMDWQINIGALPAATPGG